MNSEKVSKRILIAAGGTGGHVIPAQALAGQLDCSVLFAADGLKTNPYFDREKFSFKEVKSASPFTRGAMRAALPIGRGLVQAFHLLSTYRPNLVVGFGSFYSFPILFASRIKNVPYILVDANALPGKVNRIMAKGAVQTIVQFEEACDALPGNGVIASMPIPGKGEPITREEARSFYGFDLKRPVLLVMGGSQGARPINAAASALPQGLQILHLCGHGQEAGLRIGEGKVVLPFEENMERAYAAADLVICRGGGSTLSELIAHALPCILIPWPKSAEEHQEKNARAAARWGGARVVLEKDLADLPAEVAAALSNLPAMAERQQRRKVFLEKRTTIELVRAHLHIDREYARL